jgi:hypothetical protein
MRYYKAMMEAINKGQSRPDSVPTPRPDCDDKGDTPGDPSKHYWIPKAATVRDLTSWLAEHQGDPCLRVSVRSLSVPVVA